VEEEEEVGVEKGLWNAALEEEEDKEEEEGLLTNNEWMSVGRHNTLFA